jgi:isopentenyl-diphosphate delta-isomerase
MINPSELLFTVDENNKPIEPVGREKAHEDGIWHRTVHIYVMNKLGEILVHLRSPHVDRHPNQWDTRFGGHALAGKSYEETFQSELNEELGLTDEPMIPIGIHKHDGGTNKEFVKVYLLKFGEKIPHMKFQDGEVVDTKWMSLQGIVAAINNNPTEWVVSAEHIENMYQNLINGKL